MLSRLRKAEKELADLGGILPTGPQKIEPKKGLVEQIIDVPKKVVETAVDVPKKVVEAILPKKKEPQVVRSSKPSDRLARLQKLIAQKEKSLENVVKKHKNSMESKRKAQNVKKS